jgi:phenylalanyl-tRNA synthetase beta chain
MIISINWLKKYTNITLPVAELATLIGARLVEIERVNEIGTKYSSTYVVRIMECRPIEGTDHLNVTKIDDGGKSENIERDSNGYIQVVCGAPNVRAGITVAWLPPGSMVPNTYNDTEPFILSAKNLRGVISNGMLASAKELDLFEDHTGILELSDELQPGTTLDIALELNDTLLDIENKSLTHRPDTFGIVGFAREVAAIQDLKFSTPDWLRDVEPNYGDSNNEISSPDVFIDDANLSDRYQAVVLSGADSTRQSPLWVQTYLSRVGLRPVNAVVDVTNYLMMVSGQPLHAFDYDKVKAIGGDAPEIHVRNAREDETLELLDGRTIRMAKEDIVIAAGEVAIGLAGAMGGANTIIDDSTKNIILESATFNLFSLRSTQMRHGIFSEAITRFTKGQPAGLTAPVLAEAIRLLSEWSGAKRVSNVADVYPGIHAPISLVTSSVFVNKVLGTTLSIDEMIKTLENTEFSITNVNEDSFTVEVPYWRADIHANEDIIEEIGRLRGFDTITPKLPSRDFTAVNPSDFDTLRATIRKALVRSGANEVLTYSFVHGDVIKNANQNPENSYRVTNSISPDLQYYRQSLTPSLLGLIYPNIKKGYDDFAIFELNKVHQKTNGLTKENVPFESDHLALSIAKRKNQSTTPYYLAKTLVEYLGSSLELSFIFKAITDQGTDAVLKPFEIKRSAQIIDTKSGLIVGVVGEYKRSVSRAFKLPDYSAGFELNTRQLFEATRQRSAEYTPLSKYPSSDRDICFQVERSVEYAKIVDSVVAALRDVPVKVDISPLDIYCPEEGEYKNITIRLQFTSSERTLTGDDINSYITQISNHVIADTQATIV